MECKFLSSGFSPQCADCTGRAFQEGERIALYRQKPPMERPAWRPHSMVLECPVSVWETVGVTHGSEHRFSWPPLRAQSHVRRAVQRSRDVACDVLLEGLLHFVNCEGTLRPIIKNLGVIEDACIL